MNTAFCVDALDEVLARFGKPEIFNTDQGSQFTSAAFTGRLASTGIRISMGGRGRWIDNVFHRAAVALAEVRGCLSEGLRRRPRGPGRHCQVDRLLQRPQPHQALAGRTPMAVWREGITGPLTDNAVDMTLRLDDARASPTCPPQQQQQPTPQVA
jgi:putative transposase